MKTRGKQLKVRWSTEEWTPTIKLIVGGLRQETSEDIRTLSLQLPLHKKRVRRQKPVLWARNIARSSGLPGLNHSRIR